MFCLTPQTLKTSIFATTTLKFGLANCSVTISYKCRHPTGPRHLAPTQKDRATKTRNQQLQQMMHIWDQSLRAKQYISYWDEATVRSLWFPARPSTLLQRAGTRHLGKVCLQIQKPKPQESIKNKTDKFNQLFGLQYNTQTMMGVGQLQWQCYRQHHQNPKPCPDIVVSVEKEKKEEYAKPCT